MKDYASILYSVSCHRISFIFLVLFIGTILRFLYAKQLKKKYQHSKSGRKRQRIRDYEKRRKNNIQEAILGIIGCILAFFLWVLPPYIDAKYEDFIQVEAIYYRSSMDTRTGIPNIGGNVGITVEGNPISVELYPGYSESDYPIGTYEAVVLYSKRSKILLDVEIMTSDE